MHNIWGRSGLHISWVNKENMEREKRVNKSIVVFTNIYFIQPIVRVVNSWQSIRYVVMIFSSVSSTEQWTWTVSSWPRTVQSCSIIPTPILNQTVQSCSIIPPLSWPSFSIIPAPILTQICTILFHNTHLYLYPELYNLVL